MTTPEKHWANDWPGERVQHDGPRDKCALPDCPQGTAVSPEGRVRLLLAITDYPNLSADIVYSKQFKTEDWPRTGYALQRSDFEAVLSSLDQAREMRDANADRTDEAKKEFSDLLKVTSELGSEVGELREEIDELGKMLEAAKAEDIDNLKRENEALRKENEALQVASASTARDADRQIREAERLEVSNRELKEKLKAADKCIEELRGNILYLQIHGGEHNFAFGYQKVLDMSYVDHCRICGKPDDDSSHFGGGS